MEETRFLTGVHMATTMHEVTFLVDEFTAAIMPTKDAQQVALVWKNAMMREMVRLSKLAQGHAFPHAYNTQWNACRHCLERMLDDDDFPILYMLVEDWMLTEKVQKYLGYE